jgi:hypothetical protein
MPFFHFFADEKGNRGTERRREEKRRPFFIMIPFSTKSLPTTTGSYSRFPV